ncbi:MAG TPA: hypothetical protein VFV45_02305 [Rubrobacteraceae bacterium]|nr:hypothetical protein [Rubrobacteraceae bacterium]
MTRIRRLHPALPVVLLLLAAPAVSSAKDEKPASAPLRVAVVPYVNTTEEIGASAIMEDVLKGELKKLDAKRVTFIWAGDTERLLSDADQLARVDRLNDRFSKFGTLESTAIAGLDSILMVDAILLVKISEWENHRVPVVGAGQSHTTVALSFALYDPRTKALLWTKKPREQRFSAELDASSANVNYDETGVIQRKSDNAPPRFETVAADLVRDAFKKFPRG